MVRKLGEVDTDGEIREAFRVFDKDKNGNIPCDHLRSVFFYIMEHFSIGLNEQEIEEIIKFADENNNGSINFQEFSHIILPKKN